MHCVSSYPLKLKSKFFKLDKIKINKNIGYSGHYDNIEDAVIAISKGANFIEKHLRQKRTNEIINMLKSSKFKSLSEFRNIYLNDYTEVCSKM